MLRFQEIANPVTGWKLERIRNVARHPRSSFWEIALRSEDGCLIETQDRDFELAWFSAVRAAENRDSARAA
jgi:hypothetical protein